MVKLVFSPHFPKGVASNPYCDNFIDALSRHFSITSDHKYSFPRGIELFRNSFSADIYVVNWLESIVHFRGGTLNATFAILALYIIHLRRKKIVWMFHNIHPHSGESFLSKLIQRLLFKWSTIIVSHSQEATDYAMRRAKGSVFYKPHPLKTLHFNDWLGETKDCDFFIWGKIYPYKGVVEFLCNQTVRDSNAKIYILGKAINEDLKKLIEENLPSNTFFDNRHASFDEIAAQCKKSRFVLFPYVGDSISSSGALMDTLMMGGIPIGPNRGAFADLEKIGCCLTYERIENITDFLSKSPPYLSKDKVDSFISKNSWDAFGSWLSNELQNKRKDEQIKK